MLLGRRNFGEGVLWLGVYEVPLIPLLNPNSKPAELADTFTELAHRQTKSIFEELGLPRPNRDYSNIRPEDVSLDKVLPDRRELDSVVFEALGLTEEQQLEVYRAVVGLVKERLSKARSV